MDHKVSGQISRRSPSGLPCRKTVREPTYALLQENRSGSRVNRPIHSTAPTHLSVGSIDNSVNMLRSNIA